MKRLLIYVALLFLGFSAIRWLLNQDFFHVKTVDIVAMYDNQPLQKSNKEKIFQAVKPYLTGNTMNIQAEQAQHEAQLQAWVKQAELSRTSLTKVTLKIREFQPYAYWERNGYRAGIIDSEGKIFQAPLDLKLPQFDGNNQSLNVMVEQHKHWEKLLEPLHLHINRLQYTPRQAWTIILDNGIQLRIGNKNIDQRMLRFTKAWQQILHKQANTLDYVDLRYTNGFSTRDRPKDNSPATNEPTNFIDTEFAQTTD